MRIKTDLTKLLEPMAKECDEIRSKCDRFKDSRSSFAQCIREYRNLYIIGNPDEGLRTLHKERLTRALTLYKKKRKEDCEIYDGAYRALNGLVKEFRQRGKIIYTSFLLVLACIMARFSGRIGAAEVAKYYNLNCLEFRVMFPGIPSPKHQLSTSQVVKFMESFDAKNMEALVASLVQRIEFPIEDVCTYDNKKYMPNGPYLIRPTYGADGQEPQSTYVKGEFNRHIKGNNVITLFNCTLRIALGYVIKPKKNHERIAIINEIGPRIEFKDTVFVCDALNSTPDVSDYITSREGFYLLPIKRNAGNKELNEHLVDIFTPENDEILTSESIELGHNRREFMQISILPASDYLDTSTTKHKNIRTLVRYTKTTLSKHSDEATVTTRYYISSLPYEGEATLAQVVNSIANYWMIETHHYTLDTSKLRQDELQACNPNTVSFVVGINKIVYDVLTVKRNRISIPGKRPETYDSIMNRNGDIPTNCLIKELFRCLGVRMGLSK